MKCYIFHLTMIITTLCSLRYITRIETETVAIYPVNRVSSYYVLLAAVSQFYAPWEIPVSSHTNGIYRSSSFSVLCHDTAVWEWDVSIWWRNLHWWLRCAWTSVSWPYFTTNHECNVAFQHEWIFSDGWEMVDNSVPRPYFTTNCDCSVASLVAVPEDLKNKKYF